MNSHMLYPTISNWINEQQTSFNALVLVQTFGIGYKIANEFLSYFLETKLIEMTQFKQYITNRKGLSNE